MKDSQITNLYIYNSLYPGRPEATIENQRYFINLLKQIDISVEIYIGIVNTILKYIFQATVPFGLPSIMSHTISHFLNNPPVIFHILKPNNIPPFPFEPANDPFPCDLHLLSLRLMQTSQIKDGGSKVLLVIHRQGVDCSFIKDYSGCQTSHGKVGLIYLNNFS